MDKIDFGHMLERRRFTVSQWLQSEMIDTRTKFQAWCFNHASQYVFTEKFLNAIEEALLDIETAPRAHMTSVVDHMETVIPEDTSPVKNALVELPQQTKKNKKETVNNPAKED